jgi:SAM-dependent methyltransferase
MTQPEPPDLLSYNREAWNAAVRQGDQWTVPVTPEQVAQARKGQVEIVLTPVEKIPADWLGELAGRDVLCLASGGGQQGPLLAAAGARVTVFDNSPLQLAQDQSVAERENLQITTVQGDMRDLSVFADASFDLIIHPISNCFVPDIRPVWREAWRVLRPGGELLSGFIHPALYSYDEVLWEQDVFQLKYPIPFSALTSLSPEQLQQDYYDKGEALQFGHSLSDQIGGQIAAGFMIAGFYEDPWQRWPMDRYFPHSLATRAHKP